MSDKTLIQTLGKPITIGIAGALIAKFYYGDNLSDDLILFNQNIPAWLGFPVSLAATTLATESISNYVIPYLPANLRVSQTEKLIVEPLINAACVYALFSLGATSSSPIDLSFPLILGGGSTILGQYAYDTLSPLLVK